MAVYMVTRYYVIEEETEPDASGIPRVVNEKYHFDDYDEDKCKAWMEQHVGEYNPSDTYIKPVREEW